MSFIAIVAGDVTQTTNANVVASAPNLYIEEPVHSEFLDTPEVLNATAYSQSPLEAALKNRDCGVSCVQPVCFVAGEEERAVLRDFFLAMLTSAECGYVLYGNKPVCFMSLATPGYDPVGTLGHRLSVDLNNGIRVWRSLGIPQEGPNFILHFYDVADQDQNSWTHLLCINRSAFYRVVRENLSLFQYILGPQITPEKLLTQILDPKENFFSVLKDNKVLIGIILGFGTNNALHVNRLELIQENSNETSESDISLVPSFGYNSLFDEYQDLKSKITLSSNCLESETPQLFFGCLPDSNETKSLIHHYEEVQLAVIEVLESNDFLEKVLKKFFSDERCVLESKPKTVQALLGVFEKPEEKYDWPQIVAHCIWQEFASWSSSIEGEHVFSKFIEGMESANKKKDALYEAHLSRLNWFDLSNEELDYYKGFALWAHFKPGKKLYSIDSVIQALQEQQAMLLSSDQQISVFEVIQKLHRYLYQLHQNEEMAQAESQFRHLDPALAIVENCLYYQPIAKGEGKIIGQTDRVRLCYCIKTASGYMLKKRLDEEVDLQRAIDGLRKGLVGLREGSRGILYVHPEYGFRNTWNLPSIKPFLIIEFEIISTNSV